MPDNSMTFPYTIWLDTLDHWIVNMDEDYYGKSPHQTFCINNSYADWLNKQFNAENLHITVDASENHLYTLKSITFHTEEDYVFMVLKYG